jgi:hypothetical protein
MPSKIKHSKRPWSSSESSDDGETNLKLPRKRSRKDPELGHFSRLSLSNVSPTFSNGNGRQSEQRNAHVVYIDSLSDSEADAPQDDMDSESMEDSIQLQFPQLLAERLARLGKDEALLPIPPPKPELSLVLYKVRPILH